LSGKYTLGTDLKELVDNWKPEQMLPRAYKDERKKPVSIELK